MTPNHGPIPDHAAPAAVRVQGGSLKLLELSAVRQPDARREVGHERGHRGVALFPGIRLAKKHMTEFIL